MLVEKKNMPESCRNPILTVGGSTVFLAENNTSIIPVVGFCGT
jgi:hypothetical protein